MQRYAKRLEYNTPLPIVYLRRFAVVCLVILSLTFAVFATSPTVRDAIKDTVVTWYEKYVKFDFAKSDDRKNEITNIYELKIGYIPDGFELISYREEEHRREYVHTNSLGDSLVIIIDTTEYVDIMIDNELTDFEKLKVNGIDAYLMYNYSEHYGMLVWGNDVYSVYISATLDKSSILNIAKNIKN